MEEIFFGAALGLASGLNPGPLLTLVVTATLQRGFAAGARVAAAPLVTDTPVIVLCVVVLRQLPLAWQAALGLVGGGVVVFFGIRTGLEARRADLPTADTAGISRDFWRGVAVNVLNPNAWIFWTAVGAPLLIRTADQRPAAAVGFLAAFYTLLIGSKLAVAGLLARGRHLLTAAGYRRAIACCALLLLALGAVLLVRGWRDLSLL
jgi:threonine/homoserine/homoserine lactone efflux protein